MSPPQQWQQPARSSPSDDSRLLDLHSTPQQLQVVSLLNRSEPSPQGLSRTVLLILLVRELSGISSDSRQTQEGLEALRLFLQMLRSARSSLESLEFLLWREVIRTPRQLPSTASIRERLLTYRIRNSHSPGALFRSLKPIPWVVHLVAEVESAPAFFSLLRAVQMRHQPSIELHLFSLVDTTDLALWRLDMNLTLSQQLAQAHLVFPVRGETSTTDSLL